MTQHPIHPADLPFGEAALRADLAIRLGAIIHQKFTCEACGSRQTIEEPNRFFTEGRCEECSHITNIRDRGCGFMLELHA